MENSTMEDNLLFTRKLTVKNDSDTENQLIISMTYPVETKPEVPGVPSYICTVSICGPEGNENYTIEGVFDKFWTLFHAINFIRLKIDEIDGTVYFLNQPFSGFPLIIDHAWGMDHLMKSEKLIRDEFSSLMNEIELRRKAKYPSPDPSENNQEE